MSIFSPAFLDGLRTQDPSRWPGMLGTEEQLRDAVEARVAGLPDGLRTEVVRWLTAEDPEGALVARAALWGVELVEQVGWSCTGLAGDFALRIESPSGERALLLPLAVPARRPLSEPGDVALLIDRLESCFGGQRYLLRMRRPLPPSFDPDPVTSAVHLWLLALARGEWQGKNAVYEHDGVDLELTLTDLPVVEPGAGLVCAFHTVDHERVLTDAAEELFDGVLDCEEAEPDLPVIPIIGVPRDWRPPRWQLLGALYGLPRSTTTEAGGGAASSFRVLFRPDGRAMFCDSAQRNVASIWWVSQDGGDALGVRGWAYDNPWCEVGPVPDFPGQRLRVAAGPVRTPNLERGPAEMVWESP